MRYLEVDTKEKLDYVVDTTENMLLAQSTVTGIEYEAIYYINDDNSVYVDIWESGLEDDPDGYDDSIDYSDEF